MKRVVLTLGTLMALVTGLGQRARAETGETVPLLGDKGHLAISVDRLFGYVHPRNTTTVNGDSSTSSADVVSLLGSPINAVASIYTFPRLAFDVFVSPGFSVGGAANYFHLSQDINLSGNTTSNSSTVSGFLIAPRAGYAVRAGASVWFWPRAGITYMNLSNDLGGGDNAKVSLLAATIEAPLAVTIAPHAVILIGPTVDIGLTGSEKLNTVGGTGTSITIKETDYGLQVGLLFLI